MYLDELREELFIGMNISVCVTTIYNTLRKAGLSMKAVSMSVNLNSNTNGLYRSQRPHANVMTTRGPTTWKGFRTIGPMNVYMSMSPDLIDAIPNVSERGLSKASVLWEKSSSCVEKGMSSLVCVWPMYSCCSYSVLPALSLSGVLHVKVVEGAFNMETFNEFIAELLTRMTPFNLETRPPNSVIVLDNCRIHKDPAMIQMVLDR
jgi:hypothetical protein